MKKKKKTLSASRRFSAVVMKTLGNHQGKFASQHSGFIAPCDHLFDVEFRPKISVEMKDQL
jgi:hypothetical protein